MSITISSFINTAQFENTLRITCDGTFKGAEAIELRDAIETALLDDCSIIYLDTQSVDEADLSGINEIIHSYYTVTNATKRFVLLYKKESVIEKWVDTTGIEKFMLTAIVPANLN